LSGVYKRNRSLSSCQFYMGSVKVRAEVIRLSASNAIPKSQRFTFVQPMCMSARDAVYNIVRSNAFYPNTDENVYWRKYYLTLAIADLNMLLQDMQCLLVSGSNVSPSRLERIVEMIDDEVVLLKATRNKVKKVR